MAVRPVKPMKQQEEKLWTPNDSMQYSRNPSNAMDEIVKGTVYGGLPYVGQGGCSSIYRLMDYYNEETGVVDMAQVTDFALFGNHCSSEPHVEYIAGTDQIDGSKSYITIIEQGQDWMETTNESGDTFQMKNGVDTKMTFLQLFDRAYMPFTYAEFLGTDPIEESQYAFSFTGDTVTVDALFLGTVTANYGISDVYAIVKDSSGKEVYRHAVRAVNAGVKELQLSRNATNVVTWGELDVSDGEYTVEIQCQLSTGERPTVYTGKLVP